MGPHLQRLSSAKFWPEAKLRTFFPAAVAWFHSAQAAILKMRVPAAHPDRLVQYVIEPHAEAGLPTLKRSFTRRAAKIRAVLSETAGGRAVDRFVIAAAPQEVPVTLVDQTGLAARRQNSRRWVRSEPGTDLGEKAMATFGPHGVVPVIFAAIRTGLTVDRRVRILTAPPRQITTLGPILWTVEGGASARRHKKKEIYGWTYSGRSSWCSSAEPQAVL
jgi:hypothetical protein